MLLLLDTLPPVLTSSFTKLLHSVPHCPLLSQLQPFPPSGVRGLLSHSPYHYWDDQWKPALSWAGLESGDRHRPPREHTNRLRMLVTYLCARTLDKTVQWQAHEVPRLTTKLRRGRQKHDYLDSRVTNDVYCTCITKVKKAVVNIECYNFFCSTSQLSISGSYWRFWKYIPDKGNLP